MNNNAYKTTSVNWGKSQADISRLLTKHGISDTRFSFLNSRNELICEFNYPIKIENKEVIAGVRIVIPLPKMKDVEQAKNQIHRALFYYLKSKFEATGFGLIEFLEEFMAHLTLYDPMGNLITMGQSIIPQYKKQLLTGQQGEIKMIEEPK